MVAVGVLGEGDGYAVFAECTKDVAKDDAEAKRWWTATLRGAHEAQRRP
jgi:hypothetical protein